MNSSWRNSRTLRAAPDFFRRLETLSGFVPRWTCRRLSWTPTTWGTRATTSTRSCWRTSLPYLTRGIGRPSSQERSGGEKHSRRPSASVGCSTSSRACATLIAPSASQPTRTSRSSASRSTKSWPPRSPTRISRPRSRPALTSRKTSPSRRPRRNFGSHARCGWRLGRATMVLFWV